MGLAPVGCAPHYLCQNRSVNGECIETINNVMVDFNNAMREILDTLNRNLLDATITFCDAFNGSMDILANSRHYGEAQTWFSSLFIFSSYAFYLKRQFFVYFWARYIVSYHLSHDYCSLCGIIASMSFKSSDLCRTFSWMFFPGKLRLNSIYLSLLVKTPLKLNDETWNQIVQVHCLDLKLLVSRVMSYSV